MTKDRTVHKLTIKKGPVKKNELGKVAVVPYTCFMINSDFAEVEKS